MLIELKFFSSLSGTLHYKKTLQASVYQNNLQFKLSNLWKKKQEEVVDKLNFYNNRVHKFKFLHTQSIDTSPMAAIASKQQLVLLSGVFDFKNFAINYQAARIYYGQFCS